MKKVKVFFLTLLSALLLVGAFAIPAYAIDLYDVDNDWTSPNVTRGMSLGLSTSVRLTVGDFHYGVTALRVRVNNYNTQQRSAFAVRGASANWQDYSFEGVTLNRGVHVTSNSIRVERGQLAVGEYWYALRGDTAWRATPLLAQRR